MKKLLIAVALALFSSLAMADTGGQPPMGSGVCGQIGYGDYTGAAAGVVTVSASTTTTAGTVETFFSTATLSGSTLINVGDSIQVECAFSTAINANTKRVRIEGNTTNAFADTSAVASNNVTLNARSTITKYAASKQNYRGVASGGTSANTNNTSGVTTVRDTDPMTYACTCTNGSASQGDCSFISMSVYQCGER